MPRPASALGALAVAGQSRRQTTKSSLKPAASKRAGLSSKKSKTRLEGHASTLLVGAGIGAALTLSLVALRSKERPATFTLFNGKKSTLASALVKTAVFAIAR
ncbi:MAG TPA: hypothetical protein VIK01_00555, partial [Polyangiaceae bacterium]